MSKLEVYAARSAVICMQLAILAAVAAGIAWGMSLPDEPRICDQGCRNSEIEHEINLIKYGREKE